MVRMFERQSTSQRGHSLSGPSPGMHVAE
jgi:hypothetical protein